MTTEPCWSHSPPAGLVGRIGGTVALTIPQVTLGGTLAVEVNTTPGDATAEFLSGGVTTSLHMPTGPTLQIVGTGLSLSVLGQTLQGDLTLTRTTDAAGRTSVHVVGHNLVLQLGGAGAAAATVTQTGDADLTVSPDGLVGTVRVAVSLAAPGLSLGTPSGGYFEIAVDTRAATKMIRVQGKNVTLTVAGQTLATDLTIDRVGTVTRVGLSKCLGQPRQLCEPQQRHRTAAADPDGDGRHLRRRRRGDHPQRQPHRHVRCRGELDADRCLGGPPGRRRHRQPGPARRAVLPANGHGHGRTGSSAR